jgi:hypothetical protein
MAGVAAGAPVLLRVFDGMRRAVGAGGLDPVAREVAGLAVGVAVDNHYADPGVYQPTPPLNFVILAGWGELTPFALNSAGQFHTPAPASVTRRSRRQPGHARRLRLGTALRDSAVPRVPLDACRHRRRGGERARTRAARKGSLSRSRQG